MATEAECSSPSKRLRPGNLGGAASVSASADAAARTFAHEYSLTLYDALREDSVRMAAYKQGIEAATKDKRVLDVGTGPEALLALMAARGGAKKVTAVEVSAETASLARAAVERAGFSHIVEVLCGYSTEVQLPQVDVVIHELIGDLGLEEGLALVLADLRKRPEVVDSTKAGWVVPRRVLSWVAPCNIRPIAPADVPSDAEENEDEEEPSEMRLPSVPADALLGEKKTLEDLDDVAPINLQQVCSHTWTVTKASTLTGFACAPRMEFTAGSDGSGSAIDCWDEKTHWRYVVALLPEAVLVDPGDQIHLAAEVDLRQFPVEYRFSASLRYANPPEGTTDSTQPADLGTVVLKLDVPDGSTLDKGEKST